MIRHARCWSPRLLLLCQAEGWLKARTEEIGRAMYYDIESQKAGPDMKRVTI